MESKKRKVEKKKSAHAEISEKEIMRNSGPKVSEIRELLGVSCLRGASPAHTYKQRGKNNAITKQKANLLCEILFTNLWRYIYL